MTYFVNANRATKCENGKYECQSFYDYEMDFAVITLKMPVGKTLDYLGVGYICGEQEYDDVYTAGYPSDLPGFPWRMYGDSGALAAFDACQDDLRDSIVTSTLDTYHGQSGSGVWDSDYMIRALVNSGGSNGVTYHRTIAKWVFEAIMIVVNAGSY